MKKIIALLLSILLIASLAACGSGESQQATEKIEAAVITTPYAVINVPDDYAGNVNYEVTSEDPYTLTFTAAEDDTALYSLIFNGSGENMTLIGTLIGEKENAVLYAVIPKLDQSHQNYEAYGNYQEEMNDIIGRLSADYELVYNEIVEPDDRETFEIMTSVAVLKYPAKWKDKVSYEVGDGGVSFSAGGVAIFDILFAESDDGILIGAYNNTPVSVVFYDLDETKLDADKYAELCAMQDDANVILDHLKSDKNFSTDI